MATGIITGTTEDVTVNTIVIWKAFGAVWKGKIAPTTRHTVAELYCCSSTCTNVGLPWAETAANVHIGWYWDVDVYGIDMVIWVKGVNVKNVDLKHNSFLKGVNTLVLILSCSSILVACRK